MMVEVVTCKECVYADKYGRCSRVNWINQKDDYCSKGIKDKSKEGEGRDG